MIRKKRDMETARNAKTPREDSHLSKRREGSSLASHVAPWRKSIQPEGTACAKALGWVFPVYPEGVGGESTQPTGTMR